MKNFEYLVAMLLWSCLMSCCFGITCFGLANTDSNVCSSHGFCFAHDSCSCFSGYAGTTCEQSAASTCLFNGPPLPLVTQFPPILNAVGTNFTNDTLEIEIDMPIVKLRLDSAVTIQDSKNPNCIYPGPYWTNTLNNIYPCYNELNSMIPWSSVGVDCGWTVKNTTNATTYDGKILVKYRELVPFGQKQDVVRYVSSAFSLRLVFTTLAYNISIIIGPGFLPIEIFLTKLDILLARDFNFKNKKYLPPLTPNSGLLEFYTEVDFPYQLFDPILTAVPSGLVPTSTGVSQVLSAQNCPAILPIFCIQKWSLPLLIDTACTMTGNYSFNFTASCRTAQANCTNFTLPVTLEVFSTDFCAEIKLKVLLTGALQTYSDPGFTVPDSNFFLGDYVYSEACVNSSQATVTGVEISQIVISSQGQFRTMFANGNVLYSGKNRYLSLLPLDYRKPNCAKFQFALTNLNIIVNPTEFELILTLKVKYTSFNGNKFYSTMSFGGGSLGGRKKGQMMKLHVEEGMKQMDQITEQQQSKLLDISEIQDSELINNNGMNVDSSNEVYSAKFFARDSNVMSSGDIVKSALKSIIVGLLIWLSLI